MKSLKMPYLVCLLSIWTVLLLSLGGCAKVTAIAESSLAPPSISDSLDSFESAALAIRTSNRILLLAPISEHEEWPEKLFNMPTAKNTLRMALSGLGLKYRVTVPTVIDKETGFPRPTSPLYIMVRDRNQLLNRELQEKYVEFFRNNPASAHCPVEEDVPEASNGFVYKNALAAYGTVSGNSAELDRLQQQMEQIAKGFRQCDAWVRRSKEGDVVSAYCKDPALKDEDFRVMEIRKAQEELEEDRKAYARLSNRVYQASVAGADFTAAALAKIVATIIKSPKALHGAEHEIERWPGGIDSALLIPRIENVFSAMGIYRDNLSLQLTAYKTMYTQIEGTYPVESTEQTEEAVDRINRFTTEYAVLQPRIDRLLAGGGDVRFAAGEVTAWDVLASSWPDDPAPEAVALSAFRQVGEK